MIGKPIHIDAATSITYRGKFARICVEVDIQTNQPFRLVRC